MGVYLNPFLGSGIPTSKRPERGSSRRTSGRHRHLHCLEVPVPRRLKHMGILATTLFLMSYIIHCKPLFGKAVISQEAETMLPPDDIRDYDITTTLPPDVVACSYCKPPPLSMSSFRRQPQEGDIENNTAMRYNPPRIFSASCTSALGNPEMVVAVSTHPSRAAERKAIRNSWGWLYRSPLSRAIVKVVFFMGMVQDEGLFRDVIREDRMHGDIVMHAFSAAASGSAALQLALILDWLRQCSIATILLKVQDDTFVNVKRLLKCRDQLLNASGDVFVRLGPQFPDIRPEPCAYYFKSSVLYSLSRATIDVLLSSDEGAYIAQLVLAAHLRMVHSNLIGSCSANVDNMDPCDVHTALTVHSVSANKMVVLQRDAMSDMKCADDDT